jgi:FkbM family methyltransferase
MRQLDPEVALIGSELLPVRRRALDVGANFGLYTYAMARHARRVEVFEPMLECTSFINLWGSPKVQVHQMALADRDGTAELHVPFMGGGFASAVASLTPPDGQFRTVSVPLTTLDRFEFQDVDLIKIDVEGHEFEVLQGGLETIRHSRPNLIIEVEEWHLRRRGRTMQDVFGLVSDLGYHGAFLRAGRLVPLSEFSIEMDQVQQHGNMTPGAYINNFIFRPNERRAF